MSFTSPTARTLFSFSSLWHSAIAAQSSLAEEAVSVSVKFHSPCGFDDASGTVGEFSESFFSQGYRRRRLSSASNEASFLSVVSFLPSGLERALITSMIQSGNFIYAGSFQPLISNATSLL